MTDSKELCLICEEGYLHPQVGVNTIEYNGQSAELEIHFSICDACGSEQAGGNELRKNKRSTIKFRKQVDGLLTGSQVRSIRKNLGLSQAEAARVFGGGPVAFSKYENDDVTQSEAMDKLLRVVSDVPSAIDFLRKHADSKTNPSNTIMMDNNVSYRKVDRKIPEVSSDRVVAEAAIPNEHPMKDVGIAYGVDACSAGWFCIAIHPKEKVINGFFIEKLEQLIDNLNEEDRIFVDIPIGLSDGKDERLCDKEARRMLGRPRASSVFRAPVRASLGANNYEDAKKINLKHAGKSLPIQTFAIMPKIKEVDSLLRTSRKARAIVREIHPEICFWALNGGKSMIYSKKKEEGRKERITVLNRFHPSCGEEFQRILKAYPQKKVASDDILDAMAAAVTALASSKQTKLIPIDPCKDSCGLPMEMVYYQRLAS